jgi:transposase
MDATGQRLAKARLPEGVAGMARLHAMIGEQLGEDTEAEVLVGIETDRGPWVLALIAAGYTVYGINPLQVARYRERRSVSGAKSDAADAHTLADMVRTDSHQLRPVAADSAKAEAVKVVTRAHKTLIWERTRHTQRLRHALRDYFPAAVEAFEDLDAADTLELLAKAPDPASAARLTLAQITAALRRARRRNVADKAARIQAGCAPSTWVSPRWSPRPTRPRPAPPWRCCGPSTSRSRSCKGRSMRILVSTRTLRSSPPSPAWDRSLVPGCSPSSVTTPTATPTRNPARTTPAPARSPAPPARKRS